jgi:histidinol phosphatase-like enzyme (inositol monophosphatase family)
MSGNQPDDATLVDLANRLADAAGAVIRPYFRAAVDVENKADASPVTIADREAERVMREMIEAAFPDHGIRGEEFPFKESGNDYVWYLDPIDGTKSFICGVPLFGTLIGLVHGGRPVLGIIDQPITGERWIGTPNGAALLNGKPIATAACPDLARARIFTTGIEYYDEAKAAAYQRLAQACGTRRYSTDCYAFGLVAAGCVDIAIEANINEYDVAGVVTVIENAGGIVTDWQGEPLRFEGQRAIPSIVACGDKAIHARALELLNA